jgi:hypothetical protein
MLKSREDVLNQSGTGLGFGKRRTNIVFLTSGRSPYRSGTSAITTRDLVDLVQKGALIHTGERKHARYALNLNSD